MPTYDYLCKKCSHRFEEFQSIIAPPLKRCPRCGGKVERMISAGAGIVFKGSGFYETDYKRSSHYHSEKKKESGSPEPAKNPAPATSPSPKTATPKSDKEKKVKPNPNK